MSVTQALTIASIATTIGGHIFGGISASKAADAEADALEREAALARQEALEEADRLEKEHRKFLSRQSIMFLKGGVTLSGSPLLVLEETREEKKKQVEAQKKRAGALFQLGLDKAKRVSAEGRARLVGGLFDATSSGTSLFLQAKAAKIF